MPFESSSQVSAAGAGERMPLAIVVGGGFGGIAAALRLRAKGYAVTIHDRCDRLGGRAAVFEHEGFRDRYSSADGAGFSLQPLFRQSAFFRFHNRGEGIRDLYLVGAGTHPGAGLPGVVLSARVLDALVPDAAAREAA